MYTSHHIYLDELTQHNIAVSTSTTPLSENIHTTLNAITISISKPTNESKPFSTTPIHTNTPFLPISPRSQHHASAYIARTQCHLPHKEYKNKQSGT